MLTKNSFWKSGRCFCLFMCAVLTLPVAAQPSENQRGLMPAPPAQDNAFFSTAKSIQSQEDCLTFFEKKYAKIGPTGTPKELASVASFRQAQRSFGDQLQKVDCLRFVYKVDEVFVEGYVVKPKATVIGAPNKLPAIISNRGGNDTFSFISHDAIMMDYSYFALKGFVVIASQYRGARVWPDDVAFNIGKDEYGGKDVDDVKALIPILDGMPQVDPKRTGMMGVSRGGLMTYLAAKNNPRIKAITVVSGFADLIAEAARRPDLDKGVLSRLIPNYASNKEQALKERSVVYWPEQLDKKMPIFLIHGGEDVRASVENATSLAEKLKLREHPHKLLIYPKAGHDLHPNWFPARNEIISWFDEKLR
jgi:dipeptidyl aminopeptidase/acylaminoacyl peptidase